MSDDEVVTPTSDRLERNLGNAVNNAFECVTDVEWDDGDDSVDRLYLDSETIGEQ